MARKWWKALIPKSPRGTLRPQNRCPQCGHSWYPRGSNASLRCPACGTRFDEAVAPRQSGGCADLVASCFILTALAVAVVWAGVWLVGVMVAPNPGGEAARGPAGGRLPEAAPPGEMAPAHRPTTPATRPAPPRPAPDMPRQQAVEPLPLAPPPRAVNPLRPPPGWASEWRQVGQVKARVPAVAFGPAPLVGNRGVKLLSPTPCALVWLEFANAGPLPRTVRRYQPSYECVLTGPDGLPFAGELFGSGSLDIPLPFTQELLPGGDPVYGLLAFHADRPPAGTLTLTLDAVRVGESGRFVFAIPEAAWRR